MQKFEEKTKNDFPVWNVKKVTFYADLQVDLCKIMHSIQAQICTCDKDTSIFNFNFGQIPNEENYFLCSNSYQDSVIVKFYSQQGEIRNFCQILSDTDFLIYIVELTGTSNIDYDVTPSKVELVLAELAKNKVPFVMVLSGTESCVAKNKVTSENVMEFSTRFIRSCFDDKHTGVYEYLNESGNYFFKCFERICSRYKNLFSAGSLMLLFDNELYDASVMELYIALSVKLLKSFSWCEAEIIKL